MQQEVLCWVHNSQPMAPTVCQKNSLHITPHFSNIHLNIILSSKSRFHKSVSCSVFKLHFAHTFNFYHSWRSVPYKESGNVLTGYWTQCYRMESTVGEISMYTGPPVCVWSFSNHSTMATSCQKMLTVCSYEACVCVCVHTPNRLASHPRRAQCPLSPPSEPQISQLFHFHTC